MANRKTLGEHLRDKTWRGDRHGKQLENAKGRRVMPPKKPADLTGEAAKLWSQIVRDLKGTVSASDTIALTALCRWWHEYVRIEAAMRAADVGSPEHGRLLRALSIANKGFAAFAQKFGMTPIDRERLPPPQEPLNTSDPRAMWFAEHGQHTPKRPPTKYDRMGVPPRTPVRPADIDPPPPTSASAG